LHKQWARTVRASSFPIFAPTKRTRLTFCQTACRLQKLPPSSDPSRGRGPKTRGDTRLRPPAVPCRAAPRRADHTPPGSKAPNAAIKRARTAPRRTEHTHSLADRTTERRSTYGAALSTNLSTIVILLAHLRYRSGARSLASCRQLAARCRPCSAEDGRRR
jgi:hypothetical protein